MTKHTTRILEAEKAARQIALLPAADMPKASMRARLFRCACGCTMYGNNLQKTARGLEMPAHRNYLKAGAVCPSALK